MSETRQCATAWPGRKLIQVDGSVVIRFLIVVWQSIPLHVCLLWLHGDASPRPPRLPQARGAAGGEKGPRGNRDAGCRDARDVRCCGGTHTLRMRYALQWGRAKRPRHILALFADAGAASRHVLVACNIQRLEVWGTGARLVPLAGGRFRPQILFTPPLKCAQSVGWVTGIGPPSGVDGLGTGSRPPGSLTNFSTFWAVKVLPWPLTRP